MKKIFKKNQFVVTLLAVLIAVAGYLNYTDKLAKDEAAQQVNNTYDTIYEDDDLLTSDEDILSLDVDSSQVEAENSVEETTVEGNNEAAEGETIMEAEGNAEEESEEPGAAVLTSGRNMSDFTIEARLNREQTRSKNKETLLEVINNESISNEQKQEAVDAMVELTETSELENNIETVLEAKGFSDVIVTLSEDYADIIINTSQVSDSDRAQIEDVVTRKTELDVSKIVITPMSES